MNQTLSPSIFNKALQWMTFVVLMLAAPAAIAQTSWTGAFGTAWNDSRNWTNGVPDATDLVTIGPGVNNPVISGTTAAVARAIVIEPGRTLTIQVSGSLTVNGSASYTAPFDFTAAVNNYGTIFNNGNLILGSESAIGTYGIVNQGAFHNNADGIIRVDRSTDTGIFHLAGFFYNFGKIAIGQVANSGLHGIWNDNFFLNQASGEITIGRVSMRGLVNNSTGSGGASTSFTNLGNIAIGSANSAGMYGIENRAEFNSSGSITLDDVTASGLYNLGRFALSGSLVTGSIRATGTDGINNQGLLQVSTCGSIEITSGRLYNNTSQSIVNVGLVNVASTLEVVAGSFTNYGILKYGTLSGTVVNNSLIVNNQPAATFVYGSNFTGTINGIFTDKEGTQSAGSFVAPNTIVPSIPPGDYTLYAKVTPEGGACVHMVPFTYTVPPPAPDIIIAGNGVDISNGDTTPDVNDYTAFGSQYYASGQIVKRFVIRNTGAAPLNLTGTPSVSLSNNTDFTVIAEPVSPIAVGGNTFFEIAFDPTSAGAKTAIVSIANNAAGKDPYTFTISGEGSGVCPVIVTTEPLTWTGLLDSDWNKACNWSPASVPTRDNDVIIPTTSTSPAIAGGSVAFAKSVELQTGASLTIASTASLEVVGTKDISGVTTVFYNGGTLQNNGLLMLGGTSTTAVNGLLNAGSVVNTSCARLLVRSGELKNESSKSITSTGFVFVQNTLSNNGTFTNNGVLKYGALAGTVTNNQIVVLDRSTSIFSYGGSFSGTVNGIFLDPEATQSAGVFTAPNSFAPIGSLGIGLHALFAKVTLAGSPCEYLVAFTYEISGNQTVWTGNESADWSNTANWTAGVPGMYTEAVIPDVATHDPVIAAGQSALANAVLVEAAGVLNISTGGTLTVNGHSAYTEPFPFNFTAALNNEGTVNNAGSLIIGSVAGAGMYGIVNQGSLSNLAGGEIRVDRTTDTGIFNAFGMWTNHGGIVLGASEAIGLHGIWNDAIFNNGGEIRIDRSSARALMNNADETKSIHATFSNAATITIGATSDAGTTGIENRGAFSNLTGASIHVDRTVENAIYHATGSFINDSEITIGAAGASTVSGFVGWADFTNNGRVTVDNASIFSVHQIVGVFTNNGEVLIGQTAGGGKIGFQNESALVNHAGAKIQVDRTIDIGVAHTGGTFDNSGNIVIGSVASPGTYGFTSAAPVNNLAGGTIQVDRTVRHGISHREKLFTNAGTIRVGSIASVGVIGVSVARLIYPGAFPLFVNSGKIFADRATESSLSSLSGFTNTGEITLGANASPGQYGIYVDYGLTNEGTGHIRVDRATQSCVYVRGIFNNKGKITVGGQEAAMGKDGITIAGGTFSNQGDGDIRIDRTPYIGLNLQGGVFNNEANVVIGANAGTGNWGIVTGGHFNNNAGKISVDGADLYAVYVRPYGIFTNASLLSLGANTAIGANGIYNEETVINQATGDIRIDRSRDRGILNFVGSFTNEGNISIGGNAAIGAYGLVNRAAFTNSSGGQIHIDRSTDTGIYNYSIAKFNNAGVLTIGANEAVGAHGIFNETEFNNQAGGSIHIDRTTGAAVRNFNGTFTNAADMTVGALAEAGTYGIRNQAAFANVAGGNIKVDRVSEGIFAENNTFANAGVVTIGSSVAVGSLLTQQGSGVFRNDADGVFKGTGQVAATGFASNGGTISPGYSPGRLIFDDDADLANSTLDVEVNGITSAGTDYDQIVVNGTATLGGVLKVTSAYTPARGQEITILSASAITGTFSAFAGSASNWKVAYTPTEVKLQYLDPMPVRLIDFSAKVAETAVQLNWKTATETDNEGFHIERSTNARQWETIGFVKGNATATVEHQYAFLDGNPKLGLSYYRLRQVDFDGTTDYSVIRAVQFGTQSTEVTVWADAARVAHVRSEEPIERVTVFSLSGRVLAKGKFSSVNLASVPAGIVLVQVQTKDGVVTRKLLLP